MSEHNIEAGLVWKPMHLQPLFQQYSYYPHEENNSFSDSLFEQGICLPSGANMAENQQDTVIKLIKKHFK